MALATEQHRRGDRDAAAAPAGYDDLYRTHRARVRRLCRLLLGDADEAEDVTQEVLLKLLERWRTPEHPDSWGAWLTRVAVNACHRRRRSLWRRWWWSAAVDDFREADFPSPDATPEEDAVSRQQRGRLVAVYHRLSLRQREVFALRHVEGWSTQEVADLLGITTGSVKLHLFRANRAFRKALGALR